MRQFRTIVGVAAGAAVAVGLGTGCTKDLGNFTLLASKNIDLEHFDSRSAESAAPVSGTDQEWFNYANVKEAADRATEAGNANFLTNAHIVYTSYGITDTATVTGNPMRVSEPK